MKQEEGTTYGYGFWYLLNVLVSNIFMDRDTSHLKDSKTIEDYQGTAPTPTALETGSDVVEEEIFGYCMHGLKEWVRLVMGKTIETQELFPRRMAAASKG